MPLQNIPCTPPFAQNMGISRHFIYLPTSLIGVIAVHQEYFTYAAATSIAEGGNWAGCCNTFPSWRGNHYELDLNSRHINPVIWNIDLGVSSTHDIGMEALELFKQQTT